jgi:glycerol uptake facilitator-like aquaporin
MYVILATGNPLAIAAALALIIILLKDISYGYANPAITVVMAAVGKIDPSDIIPYCGVQIFGALVALEIYKRYNISR